MDGRTSYAVRRLRAVPHLTLCVQDTTRPYRHVSVEGEAVSIAPIDFDRELLPLVGRSLDEAARARYLAELGGPEGAPVRSTSAWRRAAGARSSGPPTKLRGARVIESPDIPELEPASSTPAGSVKVSRTVLSRRPVIVSPGWTGNVLKAIYAATSRSVSGPYISEAFSSRA